MTDQLQTDTPLLSFCIPTYNRVGALIPLVRRILQCPSHDFEIVVSDNLSTDDTVAQLRSINDPRLVILQNEVNRGALFNQVHVLIQGRGTYSALLLDKDSVDPAFIDTFITFLRRGAFSTGYCEYHKPAGTPERQFDQGAAGLLGMAYSCHHPTGYFFRKLDLRDIRIVDRFSQHNFVGNFPFEFMQAELALRGPSAIFQEPLFVPETLDDAKAIKSFTIDGVKEDAFFSPKGRMKTASRFSAHILGLPLSGDIQRQLVFDRFFQGLWHATVGYRQIMANEAICDHYHIATRRIGRLEMFMSAIFYYSGFVSELKDSQKCFAFPSAGSFLLETARRISRRFVRRVSRQFA